mgnify:CR=1 FL=1
MISHYVAPPRGQADNAAVTTAVWPVMMLFRVIAAVLLAVSVVAAPMMTGMLPAAVAQEDAQPNPDEIDVGDIDDDLLEKICKRDGDDPLPDNECKDKLVDKYGKKFEDSVCKGKDANGCIEKLLKDDKDEEEKSKREKSEAPPEDYSLYRLSSANTGLLFDAIGMSPDTASSNDEDSDDGDEGDSGESENADTDVDIEKASGLSSEWAAWIQSPANAGAFLGICDSKVTPGPTTCSRFYGDSSTKFEVNHNYSTFKNYPESDDAGHKAAQGVYVYSQFGAALTNAGFMEPINEGPNPLRMVTGNLMLAGFLFAGSIDAFFSLVLDALIALNPFRLFFEAVEANTGHDYSIADESAGGPLKGLSKFINTLYTGLVDMSWMATIPIFIGLFFMGTLMLRRYDKGGNFKKLAVRVTFIAVGFALLGSTYTAALASFKGADGNSKDINANRVVLTTYVDYDAWVMNKRLALPASVHLEWDEDKRTLHENTVVNLRDYARNINAFSNKAYKYMDDSDAEDAGLNYSGSVFKAADAESKTGSDEAGSGIQQFDATWSLLNRYIRGDTVTSVAFEDRVKASYKKMALENGANGDAALQKLFTGYTDPTVMKKMKPEDISAYAVAFVQNGGLHLGEGKNYAPKPGETSDPDTLSEGVVPFKSGADAACTADEVGSFSAEDGGKFVPAEGCNLSPLSMYNFLNTTFQDNNLTVQSGRNADSSFVKANHASVSQVGEGVMGLIYWFSSLSILVSFALIGIFYALAMLFSNIKRSIQLIAAVPFATLGFMGGIAKVIIYTIAMIAEIVMTLFVYRLMQEFLLAIPAVLEAPLVAAFASEDEVANGQALVNAANGFISIFAKNGKVAALIVTLLSTGGIIVFTMIALKLRNSIISAIDEAVTGTVNRLLDTSVGSTGAGRGSAVGRQLMTAGALAAGHRVATGGQSDVPAAVATGAGGDEGGAAGGAGGNGGNGPDGPDGGIDGNGGAQYDEHGRLVTSAVGGAGTAMTGADGQSDAFAGDDAYAEAGDGAVITDPDNPGAAATGDYYQADDGGYVDAEGNPVGMVEGPLPDGEGGYVAPDGTQLAIDENGNFVNADTGDVMYDKAGNPTGELAEEIAANGDPRGRTDAELAAQVDKQGGLSDATAKKLAGASSAVGLGAAQLADMGGADAAAQIHGSGELATAAEAGPATAKDLENAGGVEVGGDGSGLYQMSDGSVSVASDSELGQALNEAGVSEVTQSPFNSEALAAAGGTELTEGSGVYSMPDGSTVAAADSGLASANSDFVANTMDDALEHSGGAVGMSSMSSSELAAAGGQEIAAGSGMYQMEDGSVMAASDSAVAAQHAAEGGSAGSALVSDMSGKQLAAAGGTEIGDSGIYQMPNGSAMVSADSPVAEQAEEMGTSQNIAASDMTGAQLAASGAQEIGNSGVYADGSGQLIAASDGDAAGGGKAVSFGTTNGQQVAAAMQSAGSGTSVPGADSGAQGGFAAVSNAMDAMPAAAAEAKEMITGGNTAGTAAAAAGGAGLGAALTRQAAINRANGMGAAEAMQAAQQQVREGNAAGAQSGQQTGHQTTQTAQTAATGGSGAGTQMTNAAASQQQPAAPQQAAQQAQQPQRSGMNPMMYPLITTAVNKATSPGQTSQTMRDSAAGGQKNRKATPPPPQRGSMFAGMTRPMMMGMMAGNTGGQAPQRGGNQQNNGLTARDIARLRGENNRDRKPGEGRDRGDGRGRDEFSPQRGERGGQSRRGIADDAGTHGPAATGGKGGIPGTGQ